MGTNQQARAVRGATERYQCRWTVDCERSKPERIHQPSGRRPVADPCWALVMLELHSLQPLPAAFTRISLARSCGKLGADF